MHRKEANASEERVLREKLLRLLCKQSFEYSEEPRFKLAYKKEKSQYYINAKKTTLSSEGMLLVGQVIYHLIADLEVEGIGGLTFGADPIAISTAVISNLEGKRIQAFSVRKESKGHGIENWIEGSIKPDDKVVIVDDVITTGTSTLEAIKKAKEAGLNIVKVIVLVDRQEENGKENIQKEVPNVEALFTKDDLIKLYNQNQDNGAGSERSRPKESAKVNISI